MKPTKNRYYCRNCGRTKMLFDTEKRALTFMKFNNDDIKKETGVIPQRTYFCEACGGWHLTHRTDEWNGPTPTEIAINEMRKAHSNSTMDPELANFISMQLNKIYSYEKMSKPILANLLIEVLMDLLKCKPNCMRVKTKTKLLLLSSQFSETEDRKPNYVLLPNKNISYALSENGEPLSTYYNTHDKVFYLSQKTDQDKRYFLEIIRPILITLDVNEEIIIPKKLPAECDGIIFKNSMTNKTIAFYVIDKNKQSVRY